jgi:competence protein CoiA
MRIALVDGRRREAQSGLEGVCPFCGARMIARCGEVYAPHWAHYRLTECDHWWENETEWHRTWKNQFQLEWQEVVHTANDGERHIADVKTDRDWVLEFQHSYIKPEERRSREVFYEKLIWIVDGRRRERDEPQFEAAFNRGVPFAHPYARVLDSSKGRSFGDWGESRAHVFFDFGAPVIWWVLPRSNRSRAFVIAMRRDEFVQLHRTGDHDGVGFEQLAAEVDGAARNALRPRRRRPPPRRGGRRRL